MQPRDLGAAQTDARPVRAANHAIDAEIELVVWLHARVAARVEAVAGDVLAVQIVQVRTLEDLVVAAVVGDLESLVAHEQRELVLVLEQVVLDLVQERVAAVFRVLFQTLPNQPNLEYLK